MVSNRPVCLPGSRTTCKWGCTWLAPAWGNKSHMSTGYEYVGSDSCSLANLLMMYITYYCQFIYYETRYLVISPIWSSQCLHPISSESDLNWVACIWLQLWVGWLEQRSNNQLLIAAPSIYPAKRVRLIITSCLLYILKLNSHSLTSNPTITISGCHHHAWCWWSLHGPI